MASRDFNTFTPNLAFYGDFPLIDNQYDFLKIIVRNENDFSTFLSFYILVLGDHSPNGHSHLL